jgi:hypothetical protein
MLDIYHQVTKQTNESSILPTNHYFNGEIDRMFREIAADIVDRKMANFGEFLKGSEALEKAETDQYKQAGDVL